MLALCQAGKGPRVQEALRAKRAPMEICGRGSFLLTVNGLVAVMGSSSPAAYSIAQICR